ncbi:nucleotidyltransferase family protein [Prochlorococcus sp. AH-736-M13]|nr:nucleotidyltransferase family protein [Prochlorococcus sp. AH-736-M13]MDA9746856.1 nucleotidyltransferase family protein [Prochlorococcus sp. AH-736-M13]
MKKLRALLLAAGFGTRLKPITNNIPKCLVEISGKPLLGRWIQQLEVLGCDSVLLNTHYLSNLVMNYLNNLPKNRLKIKTVYEEKLKGTAGTLFDNIDFFDGYTGIFLHADNVSDFDLRNLLKAHENRPKQCLLTMLTFNCENPKTAGIIEKDTNNILVAFHEKVENPPNNCANAAIYVFDVEFIEWIKELNFKPYDFSVDIIPLLLGKIFTYHTDEVYLDIGTPSSLKFAQKFFKKSIL